jgi:pSer/pThr/pTyr-binding forkhead associated (FHA) protein
MRSMPVRIRILPGARGGGPAAARVVEIDGERAGDGDGIRIGRGPDVELPLPFAALAPVHARIFRDGARWMIEDLGGAGGTWLGAQRLQPGAPSALAAGAELAVAGVALVFDGEAAPAPRADGTATIARRLVADLLAAAPEGAAPALSVVSGPEAGRRLALRESDRPYLVGRGVACDLALDSDEVSREHAAFVWTVEGVVVRDLGSKNGVVVGGARVEGPRRLRDRDRVAIGPLSLELSDPVDRYLADLTATPAVPVPAAPPPATATRAELAAPPPPATPARASRTGRAMVVVAAGTLLAIAAAAVALLVS